MRLLRLVIADDESLICELLTRTIKFDDLGLELVGVAHDGEELLSVIRIQNPDIVITDICMPKLDGLDVIRELYEHGGRCKFIIISGYQQFEYAHNALKYDVDDYILKPINPDEINTSLKKITEGLRMSSSSTPSADYIATLRGQFIEQTVPRYAENPVSLDEVNWANHTSFREGAFRYISLKLKYSYSSMQENENLFSVLKKIRETIYQSFNDICYDVVCSTKVTNVKALLNYSPNDDEVILERMESLLKQSGTIVDLFAGFSLKLYATEKFSSLSYGNTAMSELRAAGLRCYTNRSDGVVIYRGENINEDKISAFLEEIDREISQHISNYDAPAFKAALEKIFSLPRNELFSSRVAGYLHSARKRFYSMCAAPAQDLLDADNMARIRRNANLLLQSSASWNEYKINYINSIADYMLLCKDAINQKNTRPVRFACKYIESNYSKQVKLEEVAELVHLSPVYFSMLFKKEMKQTFSDYLIEYRISQSCDLLKAGTMNVSEIAQAVGFSDVQHFSKTFKKRVGLKPSDYRKLYG